MALRAAARRTALLAAEQTSPGAGPVIVLETAKGTIEFETYPEEAPKTVAQIVGAGASRASTTASGSTAPSRTS